jgi:ribonucleoside-diphosphate reductase alpha chain
MRFMKIKEPKLSKIGQEIAEKRYLMTNMKGEVIETGGEMLWRVARYIAKAEIHWSSNGVVEKTAKAFYERMVKWKMVCAGKAMFEAGNPGGTGQLSSCFVLPIEDSIDQIFKTLGQAAVVHKNNGGTGFNFSAIRPRGDKVKNVPGAASGPVDFLSAYSAALARILQGAKRQGANIGILNIDHPDIEDFIKLKEEDGMIKNFNTSVGITNEFMEAVRRNKMWQLINPRTKEVVRKIKAKRLFDEIVEQAHRTGDPGLLFLDRVNEDNPTPTLGKIEATNPCGEISLLPYESCNLTSICLQNHVKGEEVDWDDLEKTIRLGVRFLDNMIEVNSYPITEIEAMVKNGNRRIGLGVMGWAHLLMKLRIAYDSQWAIKLADRLAAFIRSKAEDESRKLAKKRGNFPNWDVSIYAGVMPVRNCATTMIAPTGTTSMLVNTSSGIEPVFSLVIKRKTFFEGDKSNRPTKELLVIDPVFEKALDGQATKDGQAKKDILKQVTKKGLRSVKGLPKWFYKVFKTAHEVDWEAHVRMQAAWQKHFDNSISKTVNFPYEATIEEVKKAYMLAWKLGCKGVTIYRDGSKQDQVLNKVRDVRSKASLVGRQAQNICCPECGARLAMENGCNTCKQCGWSKCSL